MAGHDSGSSMCHSDPQHGLHSCLHSSGEGQVMTPAFACTTAPCSLITQPQRVLRQVMSTEIPCLALCSASPACTISKSRAPCSTVKGQAFPALTCFTLTQRVTMPASLLAKFTTIAPFTCCVQMLAQDNHKHIQCLLSCHQPPLAICITGLPAHCWQQWAVPGPSRLLMLLLVDR